jgi:T-complex protein 1 subunit theta
LYVTNDAGTVIRELDVEHPAAKLMVSASTMQEQEIGDGTNFAIIFCGSLLEAAEDLLRMVWLHCNLLYIYIYIYDRFCGLVVRVPGYYRHYQIF